MEITEEIYKIINQMDLEDIRNTKEDIMRENGKTVCRTDKGKWSMRMEKCMRENSYRERDMDLELIQPEIMYMKESGKRE